MPIKPNLIHGVVFALIVAHDIKTQIKAKELSQLFITAYEQLEEQQRADQAKIQYLCHLLKENGINADEFDLIALNFHTQ